MSKFDKKVLKDSVLNFQSKYVDWYAIRCFKCKTTPVADPGFFKGGCNYMDDFPKKNCIKLKQFGPPRGGAYPRSPVQICQRTPPKTYMSTVCYDSKEGCGLHHQETQTSYPEIGDSSLRCGL